MRAVQLSETCTDIRVLDFIQHLAVALWLWPKLPTRRQFLHSPVANSADITSLFIQCFQHKLCTRQSPRLSLVSTRAQGRGEQAARAAKKPLKAAEQTSLFQGLANAQGSLNDSNVSWTTFLGLSLLAGVTFASFIQVSHNNPNLPVSILSMF